MSEATVPTNLRLPRSLDDGVRRIAERYNLPRNTVIKFVLAAFIEEGAALTVSDALAALSTPEGAAMVRQLAGQVGPPTTSERRRKIPTQGVLS